MCLAALTKPYFLVNARNTFEVGPAVESKPPADAPVLRRICRTLRQLEALAASVISCLACCLVTSKARQDQQACMHQTIPEITPNLLECIWCTAPTEYFFLNFSPARHRLLARGMASPKLDDADIRNRCERCSALFSDPQNNGTSV